jgi:hypothetical protein
VHDLPEPPAEPEALARFPARTLRAGTGLYRIHHARLGPFWFGSATATGGARFDLEAPQGSSYWALRAEAAFLETIVRRPITVVPLELLDRYELTSVPLSADLEAANLPVQRARAFGLTAEIHTTTDASITRSWAAALHGAGFRALVAIPRHDVTARLRTVALFDHAGEHPPFGWEWDVSTGAIPTQLVDAMTSWGIRCLPIPFDTPTIPPPTKS